VADGPLARSPIRPAEPVGRVDGWEVSLRRSAAPLRLADLTPLRKTLVKAVEAPFEIPYGRARLHGVTLVVGSSPGEWIILAPPTATIDVPITGFASVIDITHGRALVRLTGAAAPQLLAKVCAIDLSELMCPDGAAFRGTVANVVTDVVRQDQSGTCSYLLHCERSSGQFLFDALLDAGTEFGIDVDGFPSHPF
jgi:heterotetrameric sarcosine oxidase gamma subunit